MEQTKEKQSALGTWLVVILSLALMIVASLLLFVPQIKLIYICYFLCGITMVAGIYMIVRYFMTDAFRNMNEYGFSIGVLTVILGVCGLIRADKLAGSFVVILGIALVCSGIIKLQYAMDLKRMKDMVMWYALLAISIAVIAAAIFVILQPFAGQLWFETATWYAMLIDGGLGILTVIYMAIRLKLFKNAEVKAAKKAEEESQAAKNAEGEDASIGYGAEDGLSAGAEANGYELQNAGESVTAQEAVNADEDIVTKNDTATENLLDSIEDR